jgi:ribosomal protein S17E
MGKIKSKQVRKAATILGKEENGLSGDFSKNKRVLSGLTPSKKVRNQVAGLLARMKRKELQN